MAEPQWMANLDPDRWAWTWPGYLPRRLLTDAFVEALALRQGVPGNDWTRIHSSNLPFRAYERDAIAWEGDGTPDSQRNAIAKALELNRLIGTEEAYYILLEINSCAGYHVYRPTGAKTVKTLTGVYTRANATPAAAGEIWLNGSTFEIWPQSADATAVGGWRAAEVIEFGSGLHLQLAANPTKSSDVYSMSILNPNSIILPGGSVTISHHSPYTGVDLYITPPVDRASDAKFITYITDRAKKVWPFTLLVIAVHILQSETTDINLYNTGFGISYIGIPDGVAL